MSNNLLSGMRIFIDPGHGGVDPGTPGYQGAFADTNNIYEKDMVLDISLFLRDLLEEENAITEMSREIDEFIPLIERARMANNFNADLFISVHLNATIRSDAGGTLVIYPAGRPEPSQRIAEIISQTIALTINTQNRGAVPRGDLVVMNATEMPAVLTEALFFTHPPEEEFILQEQNRLIVAEAIVEGIKTSVEQMPELNPDRGLNLRNLGLIAALAGTGYYLFRRERG